jgi:hypothetical protein
MSDRASETASYYLLDLGTLLVEDARKARAEALASKGTDEYEFNAGQAFAYYRVISLMHQQAVGFGLPLEAISMGGIDPDRDLMPPP